MRMGSVLTCPGSGFSVMPSYWFCLGALIFCFCGLALCLFGLIHSEMIPNSSWAFQANSLALEDANDTWVLPAYIPALDTFKNFSKSFRYTIHRRGPSRDPWGIPHAKVLAWELWIKFGC